MKAKFIFLFLTVLTFGVFAQPKVSVDVKDSFTDISENEAYSISKIYPNPVKDFVNIDIKANSSESIRMTMFNILGVQVKVWEKIYVPSGGKTLNIDLSEYKAGVYILKFTNGTRIISKVVRKS